MKRDVSKRRAGRSASDAPPRGASGSDGSTPYLPVQEERRERNIGRLLLRGYRAFHAHATKKLAEHGHTGLGIAHTTLLPHIGLEGTRLTTIARLAGMTKQAAAEVLRDLEVQGYIERAVDPADQRAVLVKLSDAGRRFLRDARGVKIDIEEEYAALVGSEALEELRQSLETIVEHYDDLTRADAPSSRIERVAQRLSPPPEKGEKNDGP